MRLVLACKVFLSACHDRIGHLGESLWRCLTFQSLLAPITMNPLRILLVAACLVALSSCTSTLRDDIAFESSPSDGFIGLRVQVNGVSSENESFIARQSIGFLRVAQQAWNSAIENACRSCSRCDNVIVRFECPGDKARSQKKLDRRLRIAQCLTQQAQGFF